MPDNNTGRRSFLAAAPLLTSLVQRTVAQQSKSAAPVSKLDANERTVIASVLPKVGVGHTAPLFFQNVSRALFPVSLALWTSLAFDYIARLSIGGTHLTYSYLKQFAVLPPSAFGPPDIAFVTPRVLELTYTSCSLKLWAEDLGYPGAPFAWDEDRRALLRAEPSVPISMRHLPRP